MVGNKPTILRTKIKTAISNYAYINREDLTDIILPDGIKSISMQAAWRFRKTWRQSDRTLLPSAKT